MCRLGAEGKFNVIWDCCVKKKMDRNRVFCASLTFRGEKTCDRSEQKIKKKKKLLLNVGFIQNKKKKEKTHIEPPPTPPLQRPHFVVAFCALVRG